MKKGSNSKQFTSPYAKAEILRILLKLSAKGIAVFNDFDIWYFSQRQTNNVLS